jgi:putative ABC transport system permease protein
MSLGLGLSMLLVIVILDRNLHSQLLGEVQQDAPTFVVTDLFEDEVPDIRAFLEEQGVLTRFQSSPMMRAAVTAVRGIPASEFVNVDEEVAFMLSGEVPITWASELPPESTVVEGEWWPADYDGPPLVSLRTRARDSLGLKIGDTLELTILGEKIEATVANFREYHFRSGLNFLVTVSPHAVDGFPSSWLATMKVVAGTEKDTERALVREFPELTFIPVGESLNQLAELLGQLGTAVNIVGGLAVVNGLLVLAGTMAAGRKQREADAVVNKVLGATRGNVLAEFAAEYALLGAFAAIIATLVGMAGAYTITLRLLDVGFAIDPLLVVVVLAGAVALTIATGALTTWQALSTKPAQYLRSLG